MQWLNDECTRYVLSKRFEGDENTGSTIEYFCLFGVLAEPSSLRSLGRPSWSISGPWAVIQRLFPEDLEIRYLCLLEEGFRVVHELTIEHIWRMI